MGLGIVDRQLRLSSREPRGVADARDPSIPSMFAADGRCTDRFCQVHPPERTCVSSRCRRLSFLVCEASSVRRSVRPSRPRWRQRRSPRARTSQPVSCAALIADGGTLWESGRRSNTRRNHERVGSSPGGSTQARRIHQGERRHAQTITVDTSRRSPWQADHRLASSRTCRRRTLQPRRRVASAPQPRQVRTCVYTSGPPRHWCGDS